MNRKPQHDVRARYGQPLTFSEKRILRYLSDGWVDKQIIHTMEISDRTLRRHMRAAMNRLGARTRIQAVAIAIRSRII